MSTLEALVGAWLFPVFLVSGAIWIMISRYRYRRRSIMVADGPQDESYRIYTDEFDMTVDAEELPAALIAVTPDLAKGWTDRSGQAWARAIDLADQVIENAVMPAASIQSFDGTAVSILIDQSGSMKGNPIAATAHAVDMVASLISNAGGQVEILGFSTVGWHGGRAYSRWQQDGKPSRPGRLCALLHVVYKGFDQATWSEESKRAMLHPDLLRENIDGEALRWAAARLETVAAKNRILIMMSDGAPVDDVTLMHNGPSYLERDLIKCIKQIENKGWIRLGAVGVGYEVNRYYAESVSSPPATIASVLLEMIVRLTR